MPPELDQFLSGSSERSRKQTETNRKQRLAQHKQNDEARPEDKRLLTRTDWNDHAYKFVARSNLIRMAQVIRLFSEFCEDVLHMPEGSGIAHFKPLGPVPDTALIRKFLFYTADSSSRGRSENTKICRRTVISYTVSFIAAFQYTNRPLEKAIKDQVLTWVQYQLTKELDLNKAVVDSRPIVYKKDFELIVKALYSPLGLRQVVSMRILLHINLFMLLMIDTCSRIHELVATAAYPNNYIRWRDIQFWAFNTEGLDERRQFRISAVVKVSNLKGQKDKPDKYKDIPLTLLSTSLCFEDSLRLILYIAILDGHFEGISTWSDLDHAISSCDSEDGRLLRIKKASLDLPLIPAIDLLSHLVDITTPIAIDAIPRQLRRIGLLCGFSDILKR